MPEPYTLDPEFEAVLTEVAADPDSILLRVPRPKVVRTLMESEARFTPMTAGLSAAERELVTVWRTELAWLLRAACTWHLTHGPTEDSVLAPAHFVDRARARHQLDEIRQRTRGMSRRGVSQRPALQELGSRAESETTAGTEALALQALYGALEVERQLSPRIASLAAISHRIAPTQEARFLASVDFARGTAPHTALGVLRALLRDPLADRERARALECIALVHAYLGNFERALQACTSGAECAGWDVHRTMSQLVYGLSLGLDRVARAAADRLARDIDPVHPAIDHFIRHHIALRRTSKWAPTIAGAELAHRSGEHLGVIGRRIANAFL